MASEGSFGSFCVDICGKKEKFYVKKGTLKKYELRSIYKETFYNYKLNGHCYIRPEMIVNQGDIVVDAGGCEGFYTRYALSMGAAKVIVFEPCRELVQGLQKTFENEINAGRVVIVEKGLGKKRYKDTLYINPNMFCASSVVIDNKCTLEQEISVISLDEALRNIDVDHIDIIKMDIEGAEVDAVIGAKRIISHCHPKMMIATYHSYYNAIKIYKICKKMYKQYRCNTYGCYQFEKPYRPYMTYLY